jgi:thiol-disulfide isomerase/thioredoxin
VTVPPRRVRTALTAAAASAVLLLAGCGTDGSPPIAPTGDDPADSAAGAAGVDVDTPELRAARKRAGIEACPAPSSPGGGAPKDPLPDVTLPCLGGGPDVDLSSLRGPMVVNLWAQWCGPCREELPHYQALHERAGDRVRVLGVDYQDTRPAWAIGLLRETGVTYASVADPGGELRVPLRVRGLPAVLFVDEQGRVVHQEFVVVRSYEQLAGMVEEHLGVAVGAPG